jgi:lipid-A-disaccharide synthase-like uncharacterized protein
MDYDQRDSIKLVVPKNFWWLWLIGAIMIFMYAISRTDINFLITAILQMFFYSRNLILKIKG